MSPARRPCLLLPRSLRKERPCFCLTGALACEKLAPAARHSPEKGPAETAERRRAASPVNGKRGPVRQGESPLRRVAAEALPHVPRGRHGCSAGMNAVRCIAQPPQGSPCRSKKTLCLGIRKGRPEGSGRPFSSRLGSGISQSRPAPHPWQPSRQPCRAGT